MMKNDKTKRPKWYHITWQGAILITLVLILGIFWISRYIMPPMGQGPAGPQIPLAPFEHRWSEGKILLVGFGDSITDGYGATPGRGYFDLLIRNDDTWTPDMKGKSLLKVFPSLSTRNLSISFTVSEEHLKDQLPRLEVQPADVFGVVVITTGGNDLIHDYGQSPPCDGALYGTSYEQGRKWAENFRRRLDALLDGIYEKFPGGCEIFLANIYDPTDGVGDIHRAPLPLPKWKDGLKVHRLFNEHILQAARARPYVHLVDIHSEFLGHGIHCRDRRNPHYRKEDPTYWYFENLEDPNDRGYDAIRRLFLLKMIEVFAQRHTSQYQMESGLYI